MTLAAVRTKLSADNLLRAEQQLLGRPTVIGYDKRFRWRWLATQLNTFIFAADFGDERVDVPAIEDYLREAIAYAMRNYTGWPRGLQSGTAAVAIFLATNHDELAEAYCRHSGAGKKFAGFTVPVLANPQTRQVISFERYPTWGRVYYPFLRQLVADLAEAPVPVPPLPK